MSDRTLPQQDDRSTVDSIDVPRARRSVLSRVDRQQDIHGTLEEQSLQVFEPKLRALNLGLDQIEQQSLPELESSLERIADAMLHPAQFGTVRFKMTSDAGVVVARITTEAQFEVGIVPILLQRKTRVLERIKLLRPEGQAKELRQHIIQHIGDDAVREDLLAMVEQQRQRQQAAEHLDTEFRKAAQDLAAEKQSIFYATAVAAARSSAARLTHVMIVSIRVMISLLVFLAVVAVAVPSLLGSPPLWVPAVLAAVAAIPVVLDILDRFAPDNSRSRSKSPLALLAQKTEGAAFRVGLARRFADRGVEEFAAAACAAGLLSQIEVVSLTVASRHRRQRHIWLITVALIGTVAIASTLVWWAAANRDINATIGQPVDLAGVFRLTVTAPATCTPATDANIDTRCTVIVEFTNTSGEDQTIWARTFGDIGPKKPTFYYTFDPEDVQGYAIAATSNNQFFKMSPDSAFDKTNLHAGESTRASLHFDVRPGIASLDEIQLALRHEQRRIHIRLRQA